VMREVIVKNQNPSFEGRRFFFFFEMTSIVDGGDQNDHGAIAWAEGR
jgi:hypothetical protein